MRQVELIREVDRLLITYGTPDLNNPTDPIDDLVFIILSSQTEAYAYHETYQALKTRYPTWDELVASSADEVAEAIQLGGLHRKRARYIMDALTTIRRDFQKISLDDLQDQSTEQALSYLKGLAGISEKSARCILLYAFGRPVFPVDTHVWRIARRLGLTPQVPKPSNGQQRDLEELIPSELRYSLHVNMVSHGRKVCTTYWPKCGECVLAELCPSRDRPDVVWAEWKKPKGAWAKYAGKDVEK